jgi:energy-coupling factor transporter transmembrane protein EcfT
LVLAGVLLAAGSWAALLPGLAALVALHALSRTGAASAWGSLRPWRVLLLVTGAAHALFGPAAPAPGDTLAGTVGALSGAGLAAGRLAGAILVAAHLARTGSPLDLARSLGWAIAPGRRLGLRVREIQAVTALALHFVPVVLAESVQTRVALEARGISLRHPRRRLRLRAALLWVLALLAGVGDRSARLALALAAKRFGSCAVTRDRFPRWSAASTALVGASALLALSRLLLP